MSKVVYLGNVDQVTDELHMDSSKQIANDENIYVNDEYWLFTTLDELKSLEERFPNINIENETVSEWVEYASMDYWINSMENLEYDDLVSKKDFISLITESVNNLSVEEVVKLDIRKLTVNTVKQLIILKLTTHIEKLTSEIND